MDDLISKRSAHERLIIAKTLLETVLQDMPTAEPELANNSPKVENGNGDLISRQAAIDAVKDAFIKDEQQYAEDALKALPSAQPEQLTDKEQRIFLAAMDREEKVCRQVDDECRNCREPYEDSLVRTCHEITRKVKGALWTI